MKVLVYEYDKMLRAGKLLNSLPFLVANQTDGVTLCRTIAEIGDILDSGKLSENAEERKNSGQDLIKIGSKKERQEKR